VLPEILEGQLTKAAAEQLTRLEKEAATD